MSGNTLPPASPDAINGQIDPDDLVAMRLSGPFRGMVLANNPGDSDFISAFGLGELLMVALPPIVAQATINGLQVNISFSGGGPFVLGHWTKIRWDDNSPDTVLSFQSGASHTYAEAGSYLIRVENINGVATHVPVTVLETALSVEA